MKTTIRKDVITYIGAFANMAPEFIEDDFILKNHPLYLDDEKLGFLTISLRDYLKTLNPEASILVTEIRKSGMTVRSTYQLIIEKAGL